MYLYGEHRGNVHAADTDPSEALLLDLPEVQHLLNQFVQPHDILVHHLRIFAQLRVARTQLCDPFVHAVDQRERRTEFVGDIDEEIKPCLVEFFALFLFDPCHDTLLLPSIMLSEQNDEKPYKPGG